SARPSSGRSSSTYELPTNLVYIGVGVFMVLIIIGRGILSIFETINVPLYLGVTGYSNANAVASAASFQFNMGLLGLLSYLAIEVFRHKIADTAPLITAVSVAAFSKILGSRQQGTWMGILGSTASVSRIVLPLLPALFATFSPMFLISLVMAVVGIVLLVWYERLVNDDKDTYGAHNPKDPYDPNWKEPKIDVMLYPETQNIPLDNLSKHLRPPPPRIPDSYDIFVGLSSFRDGERCGYTLFTGFLRAIRPHRLFFGVVDQVLENDTTCLIEYCKLAHNEWPYDDCRFRSQIRVDELHADSARGPVFARHHQQKLIHDEEFCLQVDAHSAFTKDWDLGVVSDWKATNNEMAVLSTYLHDLHNFISDDGSNNEYKLLIPPLCFGISIIVVYCVAPDHLPHVCQTMRGTNGLVRNIGADLIVESKHPQLSALWAAGFSFSKCHAEKRVPVDPYMLWMFEGEEFLRSSHLWTAGYDMYSPSRVGSVVYHNYTSIPARFEEMQVSDEAVRTRERTMAENRFRLVVDWPFEGPVNTFELTTTYAMGRARSLDQYLEFSGVTFAPDQVDAHTCRQLYWVPYADPTSVQALLGNWHMGNREKVAVGEGSAALRSSGRSFDYLPADHSVLVGVGVVLILMGGFMHSRQTKIKHHDKSDV
ncbi:hypothetical protein DYB31_011992, partial [Aphanomyces astaci]